MTYNSQNLFKAIAVTLNINTNLTENYDGSINSKYPTGDKPEGGGGELIAAYDFSDGIAPTDSNWGYSQAISGSTLEFDQFRMQGSYPLDATDSILQASISTPAVDEVNQVNIKFKAAFVGANRWGFKFIKLFGLQDAPVGNANVTIGLDYTGIDPGALYQVSFGDGTTTSNDTQNVINLDGTELSLIGRSFGTADIVMPTPNIGVTNRFQSTDWGVDEHEFEIMVRHNSGTSAETEVADGAIKLIIDGVTRVDVTGLFTRHWSNSPYFGTVRMFDVTQGGNPGIEFYYDDIVVSKNGFIL